MVTAVTMDYGYSNSGAFSSMFRRVTGATPTDYLALNESALDTLSRRWSSGSVKGCECPLENPRR
jgi:AraC-like DNA-binding protein